MYGLRKYKDGLKRTKWMLYYKTDNTMTPLKAGFNSQLEGITYLIDVIGVK